VKQEEYAGLITLKTCKWCNRSGLDKLTIEGYDHPDGWPVDESTKLQWLYVTCGCGYQWALWKLGVKRHVREG